MSKDDSKDKESFHNMIGSVSPLKQNRITPYQRPLDPVPKQRLADDKRVMAELLDASDETVSYESGDELKYLKQGYPRKLLNKLRRGDYSIQGELDLHGMIAREAKPAVHEFINECAHNDVSAIRIVHGKGLHSPDKRPVLKSLLLGWLSKNQFVIAVCSTPGNDGSTGAVYVLLGASRSS
ncbi:MAG: Smr/MutS family protein [Arenicella sp.]